MWQLNKIKTKEIIFYSKIKLENAVSARDRMTDEMYSISGKIHKKSSNLQHHKLTTPGKTVP